MHVAATIAVSEAAIGRIETERFRRPAHARGRSCNSVMEKSRECSGSAGYVAQEDLAILQTAEIYFHCKQENGKDDQNDAEKSGLILRNSRDKIAAQRPK
ncbi:MAG: hypothetical protein AB7G28_13030 [Pirellulales bacterium]